MAISSDRIIVIILSLSIVLAAYLNFKNPQCITIEANFEQMKNIQFDYKNKRYKFDKNIIN